MNMSLITLRNLPIFEIGAILSPKNLEGTVYAIFMGILNFGQIAASFLKPVPFPFSLLTYLVFCLELRSIISTLYHFCQFVDSKKP